MMSTHSPKRDYFVGLFMVYKCFLVKKKKMLGIMSSVELIFLKKIMFILSPWISREENLLQVF